MLTNYDSPKNGDYVSYIEALVKQSSLSTPLKNEDDDDIFQDFPDNFSNNETFPAEEPLKPASYTLPSPEKTAKAKDKPVTTSLFNKNIRKFVPLLLLIIFLGSFLGEPDGQGSLVLLIIIAIALYRLIATISTFTKSSRKK